MNKIYNMDYLNNNLPGNIADVIIVDPPYFRIKGDFDFKRTSIEEYLQEVVKWIKECKRILKPTGTLFWWGHAMNIAYSQVLIDKYFILLNNLVWQKTDCRTRIAPLTMSRRFPPVTERLLMYSNPDPSKTLKLIRNFPLFKKIVRYLDNWFQLTGLTRTELKTKLSIKDLSFLGHSTSVKNCFRIPNDLIWEKMNKLFPHELSYEQLIKLWAKVNDTWNERYAKIRRKFSLTEFQSDVLTFSQQSHITKKYKHPTQKPEGITNYLLTTCTNKEDTLVVPFAGSGTECAIGIRRGLTVYGYEISKKFAFIGNERLNNEIQIAKQQIGRGGAGM